MNSSFSRPIRSLYRHSALRRRAGYQREQPRRPHDFAKTQGRRPVRRDLREYGKRSDSRVRLFHARNRSFFSRCERPCCHASRVAFITGLILNLMKIIAKKNALLSEQMFYLSHKTIRGRLEAYFIDKSRKNPAGAFTAPFKRRELAEYLCVDRGADDRASSAG